MVKSLAQHPPLLEGDGFRVFLREDVLDNIRDHCLEIIDAEVMGDLVGEVYKDERGSYLEIDGHIPARHTRASRTQVHDTTEARDHFLKLKYEMYPDKKIVGWYHTHPDFGIFLSPTDKATISTSFFLWYQVSIVYDPVRKEFGVFRKEGDRYALLHHVYSYSTIPRFQEKLITNYEE